MCRICIGTENLPIKINGTKVHLPKATRVSLINSLNEQKKCKISKIYTNELRIGKIGFADCFGGLTIPKNKWEEMAKNLNLTLINENKQEKINNLPSFAA